MLVAVHTVSIYVASLWNALNGTVFIKVTNPHSSHTCMSNFSLINVLSIIIAFYQSA